MPCPPVGLWTWAASPARKARSTRRRSTIRQLMENSDCPRQLPTSTSACCRPFRHHLREGLRIASGVAAGAWWSRRRGASFAVPATAWPRSSRRDETTHARSRDHAASRSRRRRSERRPARSCREAEAKQLADRAMRAVAADEPIGLGMLAVAVGASKHRDDAGARLRQAFELGPPLDLSAALVERLAQQLFGLALRDHGPTGANARCPARFRSRRSSA